VILLTVNSINSKQNFAGKVRELFDIFIFQVLQPDSMCFPGVFQVSGIPCIFQVFQVFQVAEHPGINEISSDPFGIRIGAFNKK